MMLAPVVDVLMQVTALKGAAPKSVLDMVSDLSPLSWGVLLLLGCLSALSWGVMLAKWASFRKAEKSGREFVHDFERADTLEEATVFAKRAKPAGKFWLRINRADGAGREDLACEAAAVARTWLSTAKSTSCRSLTS